MTNTMFTAQVVAATGPNANPRLAQIMPSFLLHLHNFVREANITIPEFMAAIKLINACGEMSNRRNEIQLLCDIFGVESLVDEINGQQPPTSSTGTPSAILGPFYRPNAPLLPNGSSILNPTSSTPRYGHAIANSAFFSGRVLSSSLDGTPDTALENATVDVWQSAPNGLYEQQDPAQPEMNLRGRFTTDANGYYSFYCLRPTAYPIPTDGPVGKVLRMLDRHPWRPGHIHFIVSARDHHLLTTQIFDSGDKYIERDTAFAVKKELIVDFEPRKGDMRAEWQAEYDFVLGVE